MDVLLSTRSVVTLPCTAHTDDPSYIRNDAAVFVADAVADHVPAMAVTPAVDVKNVLGSVIVARSPEGSDAAQLAGTAPLKIFSVPDVPIVA
jgi:hypothetical protein